VVIKPAYVFLNEAGYAAGLPQALRTAAPPPRSGCADSAGSRKFGKELPLPERPRGLKQPAKPDGGPGPYAGETGMIGAVAYGGTASPK
jgi:hypothetical protein